MIYTINILQKPDKILQKMINSQFNISGKNSPKRSIFSPKLREECSYSLILQGLTNPIAFSKTHKEFSKGDKGQANFYSMYVAKNSPYFKESNQCLTHNSSFKAQENEHTKF